MIVIIKLTQAFSASARTRSGFFRSTGFNCYGIGFGLSAMSSHHRYIFSFNFKFYSGLFHYFQYFGYIVATTDNP